MNTRSNHTELPPQLHDLSVRSHDLPDPVRDALQATLSVALANTTPVQVLIDTFARLGYLPEEAKVATLRVLTMATP